MSRVLNERSFYALNKSYVIRFPRIQRDFAQGRTRNAKAAAVRADFVRDLCGSLVAEAAPIKMDFIYGEVSCLDSSVHAFLPLDGQQRLTTLFLLHWLLSPAPLRQTLKGLTYESRRAAMAFCERLQECIAQSVISSEGESASDAVKRQTWFRPVWSRDQTVRGMLVMLDALQEQLRTLPPGQNCWDKLCNMEMFQCLQTNSVAKKDEDDSLTDRIYLKMNARGLALTPFEIIKSQIVTFLDKNIQMAPGWSMTAHAIKENLDQQWLKFFFRHCGDRFDAAMTRFIALQVYFVSLSQAPDKLQAPQERGSWDENHTHLYDISADPFSFSSFAPFNKVLANRPDALIPLFRILNILSSETATYVPAIYKEKTNKVDPIRVEHPSWFMDAIIPSWDKNDHGTFYCYDFLYPSNYAQRTVVYAASIFPFSSATPNVTEQVRFKQWMRVCWNLIQNSTVTSEIKTAEDAVWLIRQLSAHAADIHTHLKSYLIPDRIYARPQLKEEKKKVEWFSDASNGVSYEQLLAAESHPLMRGRVSLLLESPETFTPRYTRFVQVMKQNDDELTRKNTTNTEPSHTLQKALVTKIRASALQTNTPLPTCNTLAAWRKIVVDHEAAMRLLLDDPVDLNEMLRTVSPELWKRRMLHNNWLWETGKTDRKGLAMIAGKIYLYTNSTNKTRAIPLDTSIPELWRKLFDHPDSDYPVLTVGITILVATSSCSRLNTLIPDGMGLINTGRLEFFPNRLIIRLFEGNTNREFTVFEPYPSVEDIAEHSVESLWQQVLSKCASLVTPASTAPVPVTPAL